jgi:hypothetical protein
LPGVSCEFYADEADLTDLLREFPTLGLFKYVEIDSALNQSNLVHFDPLDVLPAAIVSPEKPIRSQSFLVMEQDREIATRAIIRRDGSGTIRVADQNNNWDSIVIAFGGDAGDRTLIMSDINTVGDTEKARELHKKFKALVWSKTKRVGPKGTPYRLMPGAIAKAKAGWRLARDKGWQPVTDAHISPEDLEKL